MMNVKETLKRLHKKFPMMGLDELFDVLDCYVENNITIDSWQPKTWYSNTIDCSKTNGIEKAINKIDSREATSAIYKVEDGIVTLNGNKYYDGNLSTTAESSSVQLTTSH